MRIQKQVHDEKGRFAAYPEDGPIPENHAEVEATFLEPEEKHILMLVGSMMETDGQDVLDMNFIEAVKALTSIHGERTRALTEAHIRQANP